MSRRRRTERTRFFRDVGYTLVEVVIAIFVAAVMVTAAFSVVLTSKGTTGKNDRRLIAAQTARTLSNYLHNYVTACDCDVNTGACNAASCTLPGPTPRTGVASYYFNDTANGITDDRGDVYALASGDHHITGYLPAWFEAAPYNARLTYTVTVAQTVMGRPVPRVDVNVDWNEP